MKVRVPLALYVFSVATIELSLGGRALRVDLGSFISVFRRKPWLILYVPPLLGFLFFAFGISGVVSSVLIISPFAAMSFGKTIEEVDIRGLEKFFYFLLAFGCLQWLSGSSLLPDFLYSEGRKNQLPHSILASEPSFAFDALFSLAMLVFVFMRGRRSYLPIVLLLGVASVSNVLTVHQNFLIFAIGSISACFSISKSRVAFFFFSLSPLIFVYLFPYQSKALGFMFLSEFGSWRQISNVFATADAGWVEFFYTDYRSLVGGALLSERYYDLYYWIESAFSWLPFLHSIGGRILAFGVLGVFFCNMPSISRLTFKERSVLYASMLIFLYTAPKWQFFSVITIGSVLGLASRRNSYDPEVELAAPKALVQS